MITILQQLWLHSRGGRTIEDIVINNNYPCVVMRLYRQDVLVEIPTDKAILQDYCVKPSYKSNFPSNPAMLVLRLKR